MAARPPMRSRNTADGVRGLCLWACALWGCGDGAAAGAGGQLDAGRNDAASVSDAGDETGSQSAASDAALDAARDGEAGTLEAGTPADASDAKADAGPLGVHTESLCVLAGTGATRAAGQEGLAFLGTDLGWSYRHGDRLEFLFGDSWASTLAPIDDSTSDDDAYASLSLSDVPDGDAAEAACTAGSLALELGTHLDGGVAALSVGHTLDGFKTPIGGFSTADEEVGVFFAGKPRGCADDADCDGLRCDVGLGYIGEEYYDEAGLTRPCVDGSSLACLPSTMANDAGAPIPDTGLCVDPGASVSADDGPGRLMAVATQLRVGVRQAERHRYETSAWLTTRFMNHSATTVARFDPADSAAAFDYARPAQGDSGVWLLFGRPQFVGVGARGRSAELYFAYAPLPLDAPGASFRQSLRYFTGVDAAGAPQFDVDPLTAAPLDLDDGSGDTREAIDTVNQMSVRWVPEMQRWVMLYGGGISTLPRLPYTDCGVLQYFTPGECDLVQVGDGAIYLRTARDPWGPWSPPMAVLAGGDPARAGGLDSGEYGKGGLLRHPSCTDPRCAPHDAIATYLSNEYGFLYGANLIEEWTESRDGGVELYWNVSSWDPYRVSLVKTFVPWPKDGL